MRHYGMDWLRIGAFALLILYHVGMVFVPWPYHVKVPNPVVWAEIPMFLTNPWRLSLLFVVSGYASRTMLTVRPGAAAFFGDRSKRLLLPLLFGMAVIVPPQIFVELRSQHGYENSFAAFWLGDYFTAGSVAGVAVPTWSHLWFVPYLWSYSLLLALGSALCPPGIAQPQFDRAFRGWRAVAFPALYVVLLDGFIFPDVEDRHDLFTDGVAHLRYFAAFLFGVGLAGAPAVLDAFARWWKVSSAIAIACFAVIAALLLTWPDFTFPDEPLVLWAYRIARRLETWTAIAAMIGVAHRFLNHDGRHRATLAEAVFPIYLIHQTIIVVLGWWLIKARLPLPLLFLGLIAATAVGSGAFYLVARRIGPLRPLVGLKGLQKSSSSIR